MILTNTVGWWMHHYLVVLASSVTPFLLLITWQLCFSEAPEPAGTWQARFSQWSFLLLWFSSAAITVCRLHELQPLLHPCATQFQSLEGFSYVDFVPILDKLKPPKNFYFKMFLASHRFWWGQLEININKFWTIWGDKSPSGRCRLKTQRSCFVEKRELLGPTRGQQALFTVIIGNS